MHLGSHKNWKADLVRGRKKFFSGENPVRNYPK